MEIHLIKENKKKFLPLLLLADEEEEKIDRYLGEGSLYVGYINKRPMAVCVVVQKEEKTCEICNLAVDTYYQRQGYGQKMLNFIETSYNRQGNTTLLVATGDSSLTLPFYQQCGFNILAVEENYFPTHYQKPIIEGGKPLIDRIWLKKEIKE